MDSTSVLNFHAFGMSLNQLALLAVGGIELVWRVIPTSTKYTPLTMVVTLIQKIFFNATNVKP